MHGCLQDTNRDHMVCRLTITLIYNIPLVRFGISSDGVSFVKIMRALRVLRPLRTIQRNPNLRIIVNVLLACLPVSRRARPTRPTALARNLAASPHHKLKFYRTTNRSHRISYPP